MRPTRPNALGRTLLNPDGIILDGAQICTTREHVNLLGCDLTVSGFPFISQDADVTVCAQSALWMILRYFSDRYPSYAEAAPYQIGQLTSDYTLGRLYPSSGLTMWQMAEALRLSGFHPLTYYRDYTDDFEHLLYTYIESGIPCLIGLEGHVIVAYGHRSNFEGNPTPDKDKSIVFSSYFNNSFIVSDDNEFPYQPLMRQGGTPPASQYKFSDIDSFVVPLPEKVFLTAEDVQT